MTNSRMLSHYFNRTLMAFLFLSGCASAGDHRREVSPLEGDRLTVGTVQKEVRVGMSGAEVASSLGSPNVVTTDEKRREVWVYDKIFTERAYSSDRGGVAALIFGGWAGGDGGVGGVGSGSYDKNAGASATSQQTLTVIIYFDTDKRVRDFAYHTSRF